MAESGTRSGDAGRARRGGSALARWVLVALVGIAALAAAPRGRAEHESTNALTFAPVDGSSATEGTGTGEIVYNGGGSEPVSRWTATFRFAGLAPDANHTVVVQGRFGEVGSAEADAFTAVCSFRSSAAGDGGCWDYYLGQERLGVAQLRLGGEAGEPVLQATRAPGGPGAIVSTRNRHSPSPTAPGGGAATPLATPFALP